MMVFRCGNVCRNLCCQTSNHTIVRPCTTKVGVVTFDPLPDFILFHIPSACSCVRAALYLLFLVARASSLYCYCILLSSSVVNTISVSYISPNHTSLHTRHGSHSCFLPAILILNIIPTYSLEHTYAQTFRLSRLENEATQLERKQATLQYLPSYSHSPVNQPWS